MNEARRTLRCWLLSAFLGRGCDPTTERVPEALPRVRVLEPTELLVLRAGDGEAVAKVRFLSQHRRRRGGGDLGRELAGRGVGLLVEGG